MTVTKIDTVRSTVNLILVPKHYNLTFGISLLLKLCNDDALDQRQLKSYQYLNFDIFGKYIIQLFGYFYFHVSGQRHTGLER